MPKTLVFFYSLTGITSKAAGEFARAGGWDIGEIRDVHPRTGLWARSRCLIESSVGLCPRIDYRGPDPGGYDFVVLGAPVWRFHTASPLHSFFMHHQGHLKRIAFSSRSVVAAQTWSRDRRPNFSAEQTSRFRS